MKKWLQRFDDALNALDKPVVILILLLPVFVQWTVPLVRSRFWLDETVTWWTTDQGLRELITRCTFWPGSILYNSFILVLRSLGIHKEWLLRLPSLVALLIAAALLFDLARRWFSKRTAIAAAVFFCVQPWVVFAAADARPYGLGLFMVVLATWLMLRWLEAERAGYACAYGAAAGLILQFHMLFATVLVFHGIFLIAVAPRNGRIMRQGLVAVGVLMAVTFPLLPQYWYAFRDRGAHTFTAVHGVPDFVRQFLPTAGMLVSVLIAAVLPRWGGGTRERIAGRFVLLAVLWAAIPMCLLYAAEKLSGANVLVGRYALPYVPGIALCFGVILEYLSRWLRTGVVLLLFLAPWAWDCWRGEFASHTFSGNWAAAIEFVDKENRTASVPALMRSAFPESDHWDWQSVRMNDSALYAPLSFYRSSTDWHPLPASFTAKAVEAIDSFVETQRAKRQGFFFATLDDQVPAAVYVAYLRKKLGTGAQFREAGDFEGIRVYRMQW
ncbi:MAG: glycosyltransferase family 39 protein [Bryobacteraceae bacterium]